MSTKAGDPWWGFGRGLCQGQSHRPHRDSQRRVVATWPSVALKELCLGADREHFPRPSHHADRPAESELCARHLRGFAERGPVLTWGNASFSDHRKSCLAWHCPSSGAEVSWQVSGLPAGSICLLACDGLWDAGASIHWGPLRATQPRVGRLTTD